MIFPFWKKNSSSQPVSRPGTNLDWALSFSLCFFLWSPSTLPESITPMLIKIWNHQRNLEINLWSFNKSSWRFWWMDFPDFILKDLYLFYSGKPIYLFYLISFRPFIWVKSLHLLYNDRLGAHLLGGFKSFFFLREMIPNLTSVCSSNGLVQPPPNVPVGWERFVFCLSVSIDRWDISLYFRRLQHVTTFATTLSGITVLGNNLVLRHTHDFGLCGHQISSTFLFVSQNKGLGWEGRPLIFSQTQIVETFSKIFGW